MNAFLALPLTVRLAALALAGLFVGSLVNLGIYALAWFTRPISPWQKRHEKAPPRVWSDFLPVIGWFGLARESAIHGRGFWIRPLLIEIGCALAFPVLYWWEITGHLSPNVLGILPPTTATLQHIFVGHALLLALMLVATFIDFDEKTIPDEITLLGTLAGLLLTAIWPDAALPVPRPAPLLVPPSKYQPLLLTSSSEWPAWLDSSSGLLIGIAIFTAACLALLPATMTARRGWWNGVRYYFASIPRDPGWWKMLVLAVLGSIAIALTWKAGGPSWQGLLTSLVGLAVGAGTVWAVRIVGWFSLRQEAMGFGDVTLMAMIGAFVGWQASVMIFFGGPLIAVLIAVAQAITTGRRDLPYGPYLCIMTAIVVVLWPAFWQRFEPIFALGWLLPSVLVVCLALMLLMLMAWKKIESVILAWLEKKEAKRQQKTKRK